VLVHVQLDLQAQGNYLAALRVPLDHELLELGELVTYEVGVGAFLAPALVLLVLLAV
jgi:hypothetical protein